MVTIKLNIQPVVDLIQTKISRLKDKEYLLRPVAFDVIDLMTKRIHIDGVASDAGPIGTYSSSYLKYSRPKFNRSKDPKVIVSLTRQLENDWSVIATTNGYGIGFKNIFNYKKARWVESVKGKAIFDLSSNEREYVTKKVNALVNAAINE